MLLGAAAALGLATSPGSPVWAQAFPARSLRLVVPFPPGGPVDTVARTVAQRLAVAWGQPVVVDNRAGAGGIVGADLAAKAPADGTTVLVCSIHHSVLPALKAKLP